MLILSPLIADSPIKKEITNKIQLDLVAFAMSK